MANQQFPVSELADVLARAAKAEQDMGQVRSADEVKAMPRQELQRDPVLGAAWKRGWKDRDVALDQAPRSTSEPQRKRAKQAPPSRTVNPFVQPSASTTTEQGLTLGTVKATWSTTDEGVPTPTTTQPEAERRRAQRHTQGSSYRPHNAKEKIR